MTDRHQEIMELKHQAVPGYKPALVAVILAASAYLVYVFGWFHGGGGH